MRSQSFQESDNKIPVKLAPLRTDPKGPGGPMGPPYNRRVGGDLFTLDVEAPRIHRCRHGVSSVFKGPQRAHTKHFHKSTQYCYVLINKKVYLIRTTLSELFFLLTYYSQIKCPKIPKYYKALLSVTLTKENKQELISPVYA
jgi:hypothetical protein